MSDLRISLFGRFQVESEGNPLANGLDARKVQELFSYILLYRDRSHSRETLADLMWGDNPSIQSRKYLRQAIWQLQAALKQEEGKEGLLVVDSDWIAINKNIDVWIDVNEFERAFAGVQGIPGNLIEPPKAQAILSAVDLHQAGLLDGWYNDWCIFERERLQNMYLAMLNKLMMYFEAHQEYETGMLYGQRILQCDRAHERTHWRMMRLYYLAGDRTAALRQYERCVVALQEELGVEAAKWTSALYEQIRVDELEDSMIAAPEYPAPRIAEPEPRISSEPQFGNLETILAEFEKRMRQYIQVAGPARSDSR